MNKTLNAIFWDCCSEAHEIYRRMHEPRLSAFAWYRLKLRKELRERIAACRFYRTNYQLPLP